MIKRGAILSFIASLVALTFTVMVPAVVAAPPASAASTCPTPAAGAIYRTPGTKQVALTFDDGPSGQWTPQVLAMLRANGVHATFFVIGSNVRQTPSLVRSITEGGNLVGNHTESHPKLAGMSPWVQGQQLDSANDAIMAAGGPKPCFFRAPGGNFDSTTLALAKQRGMSLVQWSNDTRDWAAPPFISSSYQNSIFDRAVQPLYTNPIILMHDGSPGNYRQNTINSLQRVITYYKDHGYKFVDPAGRAFTSDNPLGNVDWANSPEPGSVRVAGWAFDPNDPTHPLLQIHVYINGVGYARTTGVVRDDVKAAYPQARHDTGFDIIVPAPGGRDHIIVYAINLGAGTNTVLYDNYKNVIGGNPVGHVDIAKSPAPGQVRVTGWEFDPSSPMSPAQIHVYINGVGRVITTGTSRPDVKAAHPETTTHQGFDATLPAPGGNVRVRVYGINIAWGANVLLLNKVIQIASPNPVGHLDSVTRVAPGQVRVAGWTFDPSAPAQALGVHVYINGVGYARSTGAYRSDVHAAYPQTTSNQGFSLTLPAPAGAVQVCVYYINIGPGVNVLGGCVPVTVS